MRGMFEHLHPCHHDQPTQKAQQHFPPDESLFPLRLNPERMLPLPLGVAFEHAGTTSPLGRVCPAQCETNKNARFVTLAGRLIRILECSGEFATHLRHTSIELPTHSCCCGYFASAGAAHHP
jgi:hypothetical protein